VESKGQTTIISRVSDADQDIIEQVRAGNTRRYALLVDRHKDKAFTLAVRLVGERMEAEELVQDAFLRAFRSLDRFRGDAAFGTWFYRILYNLCMTRVTRRRGKPERLDVDDERSLDNIFAVEAGPSVLDQLEEDETRRILAEEIGRLPEKFKAVITLFYLQDMSYEEIADVLETPLGTVKTNLFRARSLLRNMVLVRTKGEIKVA
jgi:RNA polymerase sigma factor (sigma-70 family)